MLRLTSLVPACSNGQSNMEYGLESMLNGTAVLFLVGSHKHNVFVFAFIQGPWLLMDAILGAV